MENVQDWFQDFGDQQTGLQFCLKHVKASQIEVKAGLYLTEYHVTSVADSVQDFCVFAAHFLQHLLHTLEWSQNFVCYCA